MNGYKTQPWRRNSTLKENVPNKPGIYRFYNANGKLIYVGSAKKLRHRVQSYRQKDNFREHPTKPRLRGRIDKYSYKTMPIRKARQIERKAKKDVKFNFK